MRHSLRTLLFTIMSGFLLVIALSLTLNQVTLDAHSTHNNLLSVAYHLRMTTERMVIEVASSDNNNLDLSSSMQEIDQEIKELKEYGKFPKRAFGEFLIFPTILHDNYNPELAAITTDWLRFIDIWNELMTLSPSDPVYPVIKLSATSTLANLFAKVDSFSITLETLDDMQDQNQTRVQLFFLGIGLLLLACGSYVILFRVIKPLRYLDTAVREIGHGENKQPLQVMADDELGRLSRSFDAMRMEISAAQKLLEDRVEERTAILTDAFEFSQEIVSQPDFDKLVESITQRAKHIMHTNMVSLCLVTVDVKRLELVSNTDEASPSPIRLPMGSLVGNKSMESQINDICANHRIGIADGCLSTPLYDGNHTIGALCVLRDQNTPFTEIEKHTLMLLANSAAVAISNIRLMENSRKQVELNATLTERQRLTSELHDEAAQTMNLLNLKVSELDNRLSMEERETTIPEMEEFKQLIERAQAQMRMAFSGMSAPAAQKAKDIRKELVDCVKEFSDSSGIVVDLKIGDLSSLALPALIQKQVMFIYREALTNVKRYANVKNVQVQLDHINGSLHLVVSDEGRGFDPNLAKSDHHLGLSVMQARTERVGGKLSIETAPGAGTRVTVIIPMLTGTPILQTVE